jgi:hypothetical protein
MAQNSASTSIASSENDSANLWDVQDILAERTSSTTGQRELLVVWKPSWIPKTNMIRDGPVMRRYTEANKWKWVSDAGDLIVPVEPGTTLQQDCDTACAAATAKNALSDLASKQRRYIKAGTPKRSLEGGAKKAPEPSYKKAEK